MIPLSYTERPWREGSYLPTLVTGSQTGEKYKCHHGHWTVSRNRLYRLSIKSVNQRNKVVYMDKFPGALIMIVWQYGRMVV